MEPGSSKRGSHCGTERSRRLSLEVGLVPDMGVGRIGVHAILTEGIPDCRWLAAAVQHDGYPDIPRHMSL